MFSISFSYIQTVGIAVIFLLIGRFLVNRSPKLKNLTIPGAVIGSLIFAFIHLFLNLTDIGQFKLDTSLTDLFMVIYFTTIGLNASFKSLGSSTGNISKLILLTIVGIFLQNFLAIGVGNAFDLNPLLSLLAGSPALVGGAGTAAAVSPTIEAMGFPSAVTVGLTSATIGVVIGSISAGSFGGRLIRRNQLSSKDAATLDDAAQQREAAEERDEDEDDDRATIFSKSIYRTICLIFICMFLGSYVTAAINAFIGQFVSGVQFPIIIGPMLVGATIRNLADRYDIEGNVIDLEGISAISNISLDLFLAMTIIALELWTIFDVALPIIIIILLEAVVTIAFAYVVVFRFMGKNYDAAMMTTGFIGYAMGSSSNAMAAMKSVRSKFGASPVAFLSIAIVGGLFTDFINVLVIYGFIGFYG